MSQYDSYFVQGSILLVYHKIWIEIIEATCRINAGLWKQAGGGVKVIFTDRSRVSVTSRVPDTTGGKSFLADYGNTSNDDVSCKQLSIHL